MYVVCFVVSSSMVMNLWCSWEGPMIKTFLGGVTMLSIGKLFGSIIFVLLGI